MFSSLILHLPFLPHSNASSVFDSSELLKLLMTRLLPLHVLPVGEFYPCSSSSRPPVVCRVITWAFLGGEAVSQSP